MKKYAIISFSAFFALLVVFAVFSCEKAIIPDDDTAGTTNGNLRVSVFEIEKTPFESLTRGANNSITRATEAASNVCTRLNFAIYDSSDFPSYRFVRLNSLKIS